MTVADPGSEFLDLRYRLASEMAGLVRDRPGWETVVLLVTVKAYPAMTRRSGEAVCVAGVRLDTPTPEWIRLFPVPFRALPADRQFQKYQVISLRVTRGSSDRRQESFRPDLGSMTLGPTLGTARQWVDRWTLVHDLAGVTTTCELLRLARERGQAAPSLGLIKPSVSDVRIRDNPNYKPGAPCTDIDLFGNETEVLESTPFDVVYCYRCAAPHCRGHEQTIVDWESGQFARRNLRSMTIEQARAAQRFKFLEQMCSVRRDTHFYVGNQHQHPQSFLVLGVFWPPAGSRPDPMLTFPYA